MTQQITSTNVWRELPTGEVKHFHTGQKLVATAAFAALDDGTFECGISRCRDTDQPLRSRGTALAKERLARFQRVRSGQASEAEIARSAREQSKLLVRKFANRDELIAFVEGTPFADVYAKEDRVAAFREHRTVRISS